MADFSFYCHQKTTPTAMPYTSLSGRMKTAYNHTPNKADHQHAYLGGCSQNGHKKKKKEKENKSRCPVGEEKGTEMI